MRLGKTLKLVGDVYMGIFSNSIQRIMSIVFKQIWSFGYERENYWPVQHIQFGARNQCRLVRIFYVVS